MKKASGVLAVLGLALSAPACAVSVDRATFERLGGNVRFIADDIWYWGALDKLREYSYAKPWLGVGNMLSGSRICTATWIGEDDRWSYVLTAAHCFREGTGTESPIFQTFRTFTAGVSAAFLGSSHVIAEGAGTIHVPRERVGLRPIESVRDLTTDIAIVKLPRRMTPIDNAGVPLEKPVLNDAMNESGKTIVFVGYGHWGVGDDVSPSYLPSSGAQRLYARNIAENLPLGEDPRGKGLLTLFDPVGPSARWAKLQAGDSGTAWWQFQNGRPVMVAVGNKMWRGGNLAARISANIDWIRRIYPGVRLLSNEQAKGCLVLADVSRRKYCRDPHEGFWPLPEWMRGKDIEVQADSGITVMLSDITDLAHNRLAAFTGTVENSALQRVRAMNGRLLNFKRPKTMKVWYSGAQPLGCVISLVSAEKYCLPIGSPESTDAPVPRVLLAWIRGHDVFVQADPGVSVVLYDEWGNHASFSGMVQHQQLTQVRGASGSMIDLSQPIGISVARTGQELPREDAAASAASR